MRNSKKEAVSYNKKNLRDALLALFTSCPSQSFNYKQIASTLGITQAVVKQLITQVLYELVEEKILEEVYTGKFKFKQKSGFVTGILEYNDKGTAFVAPDDYEKEIIIPRDELNHALKGDTVKVLIKPSRKGNTIFGTVTEVLKRSEKTYVGTIQSTASFSFLVPDFKQLPHDIFIPNSKLNGATGGHKAIVKITDWPARDKNPSGEVLKVLGKAGDNNTEIHAIMAEFELPYMFSENIIKAAESISDTISKEEIKKRRDFRNITTFTIDPVDAKDFDDAISIKQIKDNLWEIGVHIADVTHYVTENSVLEQEAQQRATSVYLVDRVVPMLPERLSNFICSLRPNEEKLCFSAVFEIDSKANIVSQWFGKTIINSDRRFAYEEAQEIIEAGEGDFTHELGVLNNIAKQLRENRFKHGSIAFDRAEIKFHIDENGKPTGVYYKTMKDSNKLIEEFMLLANRKVAEFVGKASRGTKKSAFVYRVHDKPNMDKLTMFSDFIRKFGYRLRMNSNKELAKSINELLDSVKGKGEQNVVETLAVRSMAKAVYSTKNLGHYGLAFDHYTHFTSPIRRYPDMMVHRLLEQCLNGEKPAKEAKLSKLCKHSSDMEQRASDAERASVKYKQVEFLSDKIGQVFDGVISGVTEWGLYVEICENKCEGMVSVRDLTDDYYVFDEENYCLFGKRSKTKYQLGDKVKIEIWKTNMYRKQIDFKLIT